METNNFSFLKEKYPKLAALGKEIEEVFYKDSQTVLMKGRVYAEELLREIVIQHEDIADLKYMKLYERIQFLEKEEILTREIARSFDSIRHLGNKHTHEYRGMDFEDAFKMHKCLYEVSIWFMEVYGDYSFVAPMYQIPENKSEKDYINKLEEMTLSLERKIELILKDATENTAIKNEVAASNEKNINDYAIADVKTVQYEEEPEYNSLLLKELSKLRESSQEAIENSNQFSAFKDYLHVERSIQGELKDSLDCMSNTENAQLLFLCGSVGDGKSHLLAYMNKKYPEILYQFDIHNDATESFDPHKSSLDTLAEVLSPFKDDEISTSSKKLILAINLGVLHNFIESEYAKEHFKKLSQFIFDAGVFDTTKVTTNQNSPHFNLISFSEYKPFELKDSGVSSSYYSSLLEKIVQPNPENPFYNAYKYDKQRGIKGYFIVNYELLMLEEVREGIISILIQSQIKHKVIISTRALLNFLFDILVPENINSEYINSGSIEKTKGLLFNLIFEGKHRSQLLSEIEKLDPIHIRSENLDIVLVELNNSLEIKNTFEKYINLNSLIEWEHEMNGLGAFQDLSESSRHLFNRTLIRMVYFMGNSDIKEVFYDKNYHNYVSYLFHFNKGNKGGLKEIQNLLKEGIFSWNGSPKENYVYLSENNHFIQTAQELSIKPFFNHLEAINENVLQRFQLEIQLGFSNQKRENPYLLDIDYSLYEMLIKLSKGYRPNKKDQENYIKFVEYIEKVMQHGSRERELLFVNHQTGMLFKLTYDEDYEEFSFRRDKS